MQEYLGRLRTVLYDQQTGDLIQYQNVDNKRQLQIEQYYQGISCIENNIKVILAMIDKIVKDNKVADNCTIVNHTKFMEDELVIGVKQFQLENTKNRGNRIFLDNTCSNQVSGLHLSTNHRLPSAADTR